MLCPTKYFLMANPTSPNKVTEGLNLIMLDLLLGKDKIWGTIDEYVYNNDKASQFFRVTN